ncbi:MAG: HAD family phosphatase [Candidatus Kerfeldbacteria bacterium]|nr:HAD family phosphatase [Candidatus Kerfeldbacteria bacterium]
MIRALLFDADGVVIDSERLWDEGQTQLLTDLGYVYDRETLKPQIIGKSLREGTAIMLKHYGSSADVDAIVERRIKIVQDLFRDRLEFVSGFLDFYKKVRVSYKTCIATALNRRLFARADERLKLTKLFCGNIFSIDEVGRRSKPDPAIFLYSAKQLGVPPEECLVLEDSPHGVEGARRAGMKCIAFTTTLSRDHLTAADQIVDSYAEIDLSNLSS